MSDDKKKVLKERARFKNKNLRITAEDYSTTYQTIYRILRDLEPAKSQLADYLRTVPRRKKLYLERLDSSDYQTVQAYIKRARSDGLKRYRQARASTSSTLIFR
jgi:hypothetical protein